MSIRDLQSAAETFAAEQGVSIQIARATVRYTVALALSSRPGFEAEASAWIRASGYSNIGEMRSALSAAIH